MDLSEKKFYIDDDPPTDPEEILELATRMYRQHLKEGENSPLFQLKHIDWDEFGRTLERMRYHHEQGKMHERLAKEAKEKGDKEVRDALPMN